MTPEEFAELRAVMSNAAKAAVESTVRRTIKDAIQPLSDQLDAMEVNVAGAVTRLNAYVEGRFAELERRIEKLERDSIPDTERPPHAE